MMTIAKIKAVALGASMVLTVGLVGVGQLVANHGSGDMHSDSEKPASIRVVANSPSGAKTTGLSALSDEQKEANERKHLVMEGKKILSVFFVLANQRKTKTMNLIRSANGELSASVNGKSMTFDESEVLQMSSFATAFTENMPAEETYVRELLELLENSFRENGGLYEVVSKNKVVVTVKKDEVTQIKIYSPLGKKIHDIKFK